MQPNAGNRADFREIAFIRMLGEELESAGILESPMFYHCVSGSGATVVKQMGMACQTMTAGSICSLRFIRRAQAEIPTINAADVDTAFNRLERFLGKSLNGLHEEFDPAWPERHMPARIHELKGKFDRVNFFLYKLSLGDRREKQRKARLTEFPQPTEAGTSNGFAVCVRVVLAMKR